jgi:preprotein translocase subunit SecF
MVVGVVIGTYSSFGIAAPIVVAWHKFHPNTGAAGATPGRNLATARR